MIAVLFHQPDIVNQGRIPALVRRYCYRRLPQGMSQEVRFLLSLLITKVALFSNGGYIDDTSYKICEPLMFLTYGELHNNALNAQG